MPSLPTSGKEAVSVTNEIEMMTNITYLTRRTMMGYEQIMELPYPIFLSYLKHNRIMDMQETPEGREYLEKIERIKVKTPDFAKLRQVSDYKQRGGEN